MFAGPEQSIFKWGSGILQHNAYMVLLVSINIHGRDNGPSRMVRWGWFGRSRSFGQSGTILSPLNRSHINESLVSQSTDSCITQAWTRLESSKFAYIFAVIALRCQVCYQARCTNMPYCVACFGNVAESIQPWDLLRVRLVWHIIAFSECEVSAHVRHWVITHEGSEKRGLCYSTQMFVQFGYATLIRHVRANWQV